MKEQSPDAVSTLLELLADFSGNALQDVDTLRSFLHAARDNRDSEFIGRLAFQGKYLTRISSALARHAGAGGEHIGVLEREFTQAANDFREEISTGIDNCSETMRESVQRDYLAVDKRALRRLLALAHDFSWLKDFELAMQQASASKGAGRLDAE